MKIIEVRDGFIRFEADESVYLSSFIQTEGMDKNYIAQVSQIKQIASARIATAKFLFTMNSDGLQNYDKTLPSKDSEISVFTSNILSNSINAKLPVIIGKTLDNNNNIIIDLSAFDKKMLISIDDIKMNNLISKNLSVQFNNLGKKTLLLDTLGVIKAGKFSAGVDFKLPVNTQILDFIYKSCLDDATGESKSIIAEIFSDLSEYSKSVPFVPFGALKAIVDDMVDNQHIFKLLVLKNKLAKFDKLGYFANNQNEVNNIDKIFEANEVVIDLSKLDGLFMNAYLEYIYSKAEDKDVQILLETSDIVSKKNLKSIITDSKASTTLIVNSKYKYINNIRDMFDNFIVEPTMANSITFRTYGQFFSCMQKGMYLSVGEGINYIPMVSVAQTIDDVITLDDSCENISLDTEAEPESDVLSEENADTADIVNNADTVDDIDDTPEETEDVQTETPRVKISQNEIIAGIEEKSDEVIQAVSESITEQDNLELFDDSEEPDESTDIDIEIDITDEEPEDSVEESEETIEKLEFAENVEKEEIIEPEYTDIDDNSVSEIAEEQDLIEEIQEEPDNVELLQENSELIQDLEDDDISEELISQEDEESDFDQIEESVEQSDMQIQSDNLLQEELMQEDMDLSAGENLLDSDENEEVVVETDLNDLELQLEEESENEIISQEITEQKQENQASVLDVDLDEPPVMLLNEEDNLTDFEEIAELDAEDVNEDDIVVDMTNEGSDIINIDEELDQQIVEDVDKVYTTMKEPEDFEEISDSDLDLIDELNSDEENDLEEASGELEEVSDSEISEDILEQPNESIIPERQGHNKEPEILEKREANTPIVPVYDADIPQEDMVVSDPIQQGDAVVHAKYGSGVVEKMIKYGTKTLFSINFENIGRRLLDPTLTEIKRL